eukprot:scaffold3023_cov175-Amphora_coffeaeformis.AAC.6
MACSNSLSIPSAFSVMAATRAAAILNATVELPARVSPESIRRSQVREKQESISPITDNCCSVQGEIFHVNSADVSSPTSSTSEVVL